MVQDEGLYPLGSKEQGSRCSSHHSARSQEYILKKGRCQSTGTPASRLRQPVEDLKALDGAPYQVLNQIFASLKLSFHQLQCFRPRFEIGVDTLLLLDVDSSPAPVCSSLRFRVSAQIFQYSGLLLGLICKGEEHSRQQQQGHCGKAQIYVITVVGP